MLQATDRFGRWRQEKVAKIVQCGEPDRTKVAGIGIGGLFLSVVVDTFPPRCDRLRLAERRALSSTPDIDRVVADLLVMFDGHAGEVQDLRLESGLP
jgi:hypothetical protein